MATQTYDYTAAVARALALIKKYGAAAKLHRSSNATYDPNTATSVESEDSVDVYAALFDYRRLSSGLIRDTDILVGDKLAYVNAVAGAAPKASDVLEFPVGGQRWKVITVRDEAPAGQSVVYELQVRQ